MRWASVCALLAASCSASDIVHVPAKSKVVLADGGVNESAWNELCQMQGATDGCDLCATSGWYGDTACDAFCPTPDPDCLEQNLIVNPGFDNDLSGWSLSGSVTRVASGYAGYGAQIGPSSGIVQDLAATPGAYALSAYLHSSGMTRNDFWFGGYCYDAAFNAIPIIEGFFGTPAPNYQRYVTTFTCGPDTVLLEVFLGDQSNGSVFADELILARVVAP